MTMTSRKLKDYASGRKCRSEWKKTVVWVQKAADGSKPAHCKPWHHCAQSVKSHKTYESQRSIMKELQYRAKQDNLKKIYSNILVIELLFVTKDYRYHKIGGIFLVFT